QDFADNAWNRALLQTLPRLLVLLVRWIAQSKAKSLAAAYSVLPDLEESGGTLKSNVLGQEISYDSLVLAVRNEPLVPVLKCPPGVSGAPPDVAFVRGQEAVWLPPPFGSVCRLWRRRRSASPSTRPCGTPYGRWTTRS
ncbi:unnamed protein product, partial [Prorocentrum cordatum]